MSIEQIGIVDAIGVDKETGKVVLTISDHLEWNSEHLLLLQEKLNLYIGFVENGELLEVYPDSKGREVIVNVNCKYPPDVRGMEFLSRVGSVVKQAGIGFSFQVF
ncbi:DUF6572 domain-containing protein [Pseudomonas syringae group genomosp. 3]|uniref:DUF6572 domain-containing protein n=1 Tax=Pseudomonas syringae group genomosp. 3 TaxID=251701 RepID=UPI0005C7F8AB|nr:DUF6572 domain-containing protein [Pseudomonas syringae group genomosp. 3]